MSEKNRGVDGSIGCMCNTLSRAERRWKYGINIQLGRLAVHVLIPPTYLPTLE